MIIQLSRPGQFALQRPQSARIGPGYRGSAKKGGFDKKQLRPAANRGKGAND
jgi:hypothetical protein